MALGASYCLQAQREYAPIIWASPLVLPPELKVIALHWIETDEPLCWLDFSKDEVKLHRGEVWKIEHIGFVGP